MARNVMEDACVHVCRPPGKLVLKRTSALKAQTLRHPLSLRPPNYSRATQMEAYNKAVFDMTTPLGQATSPMNSRMVLQLESG
jgi:hypothetical protein